jgi:hypothetical protein
MLLLLGRSLIKLEQLILEGRIIYDEIHKFLTGEGIVESAV